MLWRSVETRLSAGGSLYEEQYLQIRETRPTENERRALWKFTPAELNTEDDLTTRNGNRDQR